MTWSLSPQAALRERPAVLMLVGNKSDRSSERAVLSEDGRRMALVRKSSRVVYTSGVHVSMLYQIRLTYSKCMTTIMSL